MMQHSLKPTAVASGSEQIAQTARWRDRVHANILALPERGKEAAELLLWIEHVEGGL